MTRQEREAARLAQHIINFGGSKAIKRLQRLHAKINRRRNSMPMHSILQAIPWPDSVTNVTEQAEYLGISRQNLYNWISGQSRPGLKMASKIAKLTGLKVEDIRGS